MRDGRQLARFVADRKVALWTGKSAVPSLAEAIAGRRLTGSWMANPEVNLIYRLMGKLEGDVLSAPLILGKGTVMTEDVGHALHCLAVDDDRRAAARRQLSPLAAELLDAVGREGEVRMDTFDVPSAAGRKARHELEHAFLVASHEFHTERGAHASILTPWPASPLATRVAAAGPIALSDAEDRLVLAAMHAAVLAPAREARRWFPGSAGTVDRLLAGGRLCQLVDGKQTFVTTAG